MGYIPAAQLSSFLPGCRLHGPDSPPGRFLLQLALLSFGSCRSAGMRRRAGRRRAARGLASPRPRLDGCQREDGDRGRGNAWHRNSEGRGRRWNGPSVASLATEPLGLRCQALPRIAADVCASGCDMARSEEMPRPCCSRASRKTAMSLSFQRSGYGLATTSGFWAAGWCSPPGVPTPGPVGKPYAPSPRSLDSSTFALPLSTAGSGPPM